jgi:hypothetical protein
MCTSSVNDNGGKSEKMCYHKFLSCFVLDIHELTFKLGRRKFISY